MAVIPGNIEGIFPHRLHFFGPGRLFVHGQQRGGLFGGLAWIAMVGVALFRAGGAGACVAQPLEGEVRVVAVVPLDVHSCAGGDVDFDGFGVNYGHRNKYIQLGLTGSRIARIAIIAEIAKIGWFERALIPVPSWDSMDLEGLKVPQSKAQRSNPVA